MKYLRTTYKESESGIALIFALITVLVLSILAVAIMTTSQAQTWTAFNYRLTSEARYAAEAGVQQTMNWLSSTNYTAPTTFTSYTMTTNPVQYGGKPVVLSAVSGVSSNYPDSTVVSKFASAAVGTLPNVSGVSYATYATLLRMTASSGASWLPGSGTGVMQTWQITSVGTIGGLRSSSVQLVETFERTGEPIFQYGLEALGTGCGAITLEGSDYTDAYNSALGVYSSTNKSDTAGSIATNGSVSLEGTGSGAAVVNGNVASPIALPKAGVGTSCTNTSGVASTGLTDTHTGSPQNYGSFTSITTLKAPLPFGCTAQPCYPTYPAPITTPQNVSTGCASISGCKENITAASKSESLNDGGTTTYVNDFSLAPCTTTTGCTTGSYGNLTINNADVVHVTAGTYTVNSLNFTGDGQIVVDSGPVVFQLAGNCPTSGGGCPTETGIPTSVTGLSTSSKIQEVIYGAGYAGVNACAPSGGKGVIANPNVYGSESCGSAKSAFSGIPSNFQIVYGGTNLVRLGGMPNAAVVYEPAGEYYTPGAPVGLYGSIITNTFDDSSGSPFHYDTAEQNNVMQVGIFRPVGGFSWSKF